MSFRQEGYQVAPFKALNMTPNSAVTADGGEIGQAQAIQAEAAGLEPEIDFNPILIKPEGQGRTQLFVHGRPLAQLRCDTASQPDLWLYTVESLERLRTRFDLLILEGSGSPAEVNLRATDVANMRVAQYASAPVILVGDIDRGGVFAALVGTLALLEPDERALIRALVVNKFRGELAQFRFGIEFLESHTNLPVAGVVPYLPKLDIAEEDDVPLDTYQPRNEVKIGETVDPYDRLADVLRTNLDLHLIRSIAGLKSPGLKQCPSENDEEGEGGDNLDDTQESP